MRGVLPKESPEHSSALKYFNESRSHTGVTGSLRSDPGFSQCGHGGQHQAGHEERPVNESLGNCSANA